MSQNLKDYVLIYGDGASKGNPGPAGFGFMVVFPSGLVNEGGGGVAKATNNQMELMAVIEGLKLVRKESPQSIVVLTDSSYTINGVSSWVDKWIKNSWMTSTGKAVANRDLWEQLRSLNKELKPKYQHVKGHAGIPGNERVDSIADHFARGEDIELYNGSLEHYSVDPYELPKPQPMAPTQKKKASFSGKKNNVYLSLVNGNFAIDKTWKECEARVKCRSGAKCKKAASDTEIEAIKKDWGV
ncbi:MAG: ribonuclease HI [Oligoflexales bacterium]|nr:ribonuclease HI [Oligoflexales bacterium]